MIETFRLVVTTLTGLIVGSFLNVVIWRLPRGENLATPRSKCPGCDKFIAWYDNIPVISWLLLRAKCRGCKSRIAFRYPMVELLTGALFLATALTFGHHMVTMVTVCLVMAGLVALTFIDWDHMIIPDEISLGGLVLGLVTAPFTLLPAHPTTLISGVSPALDALAIAAFGAVVGGGIVYAIGWVGKAILKKEAMGFGDVKLMAFLGAFVGPLHVLFVLVLGSIAGSLIGIGLFLVGKYKSIPCQVEVSGDDWQATFDGARIVDGKLVLPGAPTARQGERVKIQWDLPAERILEEEDARILTKGKIVETDAKGAWRIELKTLRDADDERVDIFRRSNTMIPFGPFLALGGAILLLAGPAVHHFVTVTYPEMTRALID